MEGVRRIAAQACRGGTKGVCHELRPSRYRKGGEIAIQDVVGDWIVVIRIGRPDAPWRRCSPYADLLHQSGDALAADLPTASPQCLMDPRTTVDTAAFVRDDRDLPLQALIVGPTTTPRMMPPTMESRHGHLQRVAHPLDRIKRHMLEDEAVLHICSRMKNSVAFLKSPAPSAGAPPRDAAEQTRHFP